MNGIVLNCEWVRSGVILCGLKYNNEESLLNSYKFMAHWLHFSDTDLSFHGYSYLEQDR